MDEAQRQLFECYAISMGLIDYCNAMIKRRERLNPVHVKNQMEALTNLVEELDSRPLKVRK